MNKKNQYKQLILFLISTVFVLLQTALFAFIWFEYYNRPDVMEPFYNRGNYVMIALYAAMCFLFYKFFGCFRVGYLRVYDTVFTLATALLCINTITYFQLCLICRWTFWEHVLPILVMTLIDVVLLTVWTVFSRWLYLKLSPPRDLLVVYGEYSPDNLMAKLASRPDKYLVKEAIRFDSDIDVIKEKMLTSGGVVLTDIPSHERNLLLKFGFEHDIRCYSVPKISDVMIMNAASINLFDTSLLLFRNNGISIGQRAAKRLFDILVSIIGIIVSSPLLLIIALLIKLYDGGPVFFTQERLTRGGKVFQIIKFRSMRVRKDEAEYVMTRKNDDRITPVGKILRNLHFDELPQLFNILKGDMSIVGPRPECPHLAEEYCKIIPEFSFRLKVKAGLTGYAQVYGKYNTTPYDKLKLDLTYIKRYSFWLDLKLIFMTFKILFQKENTEGIDPWQKSAATKDNLEKLGKQ